MKLLTITSAVLITVAGAAPAFAQSPLSREQVRAELFEAVRTGEITQAGDQGLKLNELFPNQYPAVAKPAGKSRDAVRAELAEAIRNGELTALRNSNTDVGTGYPELYSRSADRPQLTREQVKAELAEALRTGSIERSRDAG